MKHTLHEQISALVDDELAESGLALLARRIGSNDDLHQRLSRYQLISDALQNHLPERIDPAFSKRVQAAIQEEPAVNPDRSGGRRLAALLRPVAGLAVAASVALVAVLSIQSIRQEEPSLPAVATAPVSSDYIRAQDTGQPDILPQARKRLDIYLVNHSEYAANRGMQGMLPYVRIIGHEMTSDGKE
ncbi:MAG: sigma-E factor negative regulatory protein [Pseudomonadota bacterium]|nr:sigma-E factor negative regulatory protein [Pseudomonadota bacterium]